MNGWWELEKKIIVDAETAVSGNKDDQADNLCVQNIVDSLRRPRSEHRVKQLLKALGWADPQSKRGTSGWTWSEEFVKRPEGKIARKDDLEKLESVLRLLRDDD